MNNGGGEPAKYNNLPDHNSNPDILAQQPNPYPGQMAGPQVGVPGAHVGGPGGYVGGPSGGNVGGGQAYGPGGQMAQPMMMPQGNPMMNPNHQNMGPQMMQNQQYMPPQMMGQHGGPVGVPIGQPVLMMNPMDPAIAYPKVAKTKHAQDIYCLRCQRVVKTVVHKKRGEGSWMLSGCLCLFGCVLGCCCIPLVYDECFDVVHFCPSCQTKLGKVRFLLD